MAHIKGYLKAWPHPVAVCISVLSSFLFSHLHYNYVNALKYYKLHTLSARRRYLGVLFIKRILSVVQNIVLPFWKLVAYACHIEMFETSASIMSTLNVESFLPLDSLWRPMPSTVIPVYYVEVRCRLIWLAIWYFTV